MGGAIWWFDSQSSSDDVVIDVDDDGQASFYCRVRLADEGVNAVSWRHAYVV